MFVCRHCKDYELCKLGNYKNLFTDLDHPIFTDNVEDALKMYSKTTGENVTFSDETYENYPHKVVQLYKVIMNIRAQKRKKEMKNAKGK